MPDQVEAALWWMLAISVLMLVASPLIVAALLVWMPADYFVRRRSFGQGQSSAVRLLLRLAKNFMGALFVAAGIVMLVAPGQGMLTILIGISLLDFPGKRRLELRIARMPRVYHAVNRLRARFGKPPYEVPARFGQPSLSRE